jgi:hypothetical protein
LFIEEALIKECNGLVNWVNEFLDLALLLTLPIELVILTIILKYYFFLITQNSIIIYKNIKALTIKITNIYH